ncbi:MAG: dethiobiotin synthase [Hyphomicrobiaceae bacterium]
MAARLFVTGTDTGVGKTVAAAWLTLALDAVYWKPVQTGAGEDCDTTTVRQVTGLPDERFPPNAVALPEPLSPHEAALRAGVVISPEAIVDATPATARPLVIEGAGGVLVPLTDDVMMVDLAKRLGATAVLVCRTTLGTINHTLLSLEALRARSVPIAGVILCGPPAPHNRRAIERFGRVGVIAEIPQLAALTRAALAAIPGEIDLKQLLATP